MEPMEPRKLVNQRNDCEPDPPLKTDLRDDSSKSGKENAVIWHMRSWPRKSKAAAVTEVARESICATNTGLSECNRSSTAVLRPSRTQSIDLMKKGRASTRSLPAEVTTTRINIASSGSFPVLNTPDGLPSTVKLDNGQSHTDQEPPNTLPDLKDVAESDQAESKGSPGAGGETTDPGLTAEKDIQTSTTNRSSGWFAWLSRKDGIDDPVASEHTENTDRSPDKSLPKDEVTPEPEPEGVSQPTANSDQGNIETTIQGPLATDDNTSLATSQKRSWLFMWTSGSAPQQADSGNGESEQAGIRLVEEGPTKSDQTASAQHGDISETENGVSVNEDTRPPAKDMPKSWLFWPRDKQPVETGRSGLQEIQATTLDAPQQDTAETSADKAGAKVDPTLPTTKPKIVSKAGSLKSAKATAALSIEPPSEQARQPASSRVKKTQALPNLVLPSFESTFPLQERPGLLRQLGRLIYYDKGPTPNHVLRAHDRPQVKKALAIGVHGYFPAPLIRNIIGQPTGTSMKFATMAEQAILQWAAVNGSPCQVEKIMLEGEGRISERVDLLWKLLLNWIDHIRTADFIMVSCHSQGVPVATMLVAKLIAFGCVSSTRIGICAMAGVNLGPFPDYRSRWISGSAGELFDFANGESKVSLDYMAALQTALDFGVRITVSHLVGFAMKLRNLGISDHGLIRELSSPLAGSLYSGEGHSRLYDDETVYRLAVQFALETTSASNTKLEIHQHRASAPANPYILPFAMRGVLEEEYVRRELSQETTELLQQFDDWKPSTKVLKDVKFRLEGIRSKL
ncbi:predicted protein [Uncinocarpus reesii 1704]|uniref:YMC020W-like alpha/beta hydrolase domain-containing protein n=1 Tax=Uncinocarpus reesii (strain UAMH 1704) TaxID=336963 RepID=C4JRH2_UNCRE|nr:uncharacterized protein UREG_05061 [Uncinocarpus reesii 1704]EEP80219.1 predicted protein [Uncinocarpus reesii 1704]